jgi:zinc transporter, ZIP family
MASALGWGAVAASSLVIGALLGTARRWPAAQVGIVLAFGAGALISAVSFELVEEGMRIGGAGWVAAGLALGALVFFFADRAVERRFAGAGDSASPALALGAFLDGIPEQAVLGISIAEGGGVSVALLAAIFVSNLPEAIGSAGDTQVSARSIRLLWTGVAALCAAATVVGYAIADVTGGDFNAAVNGFAAGALLVMLVDSMIPAARSKAGRIAGLATTLGFAVATALSSLG